ncbi:hypothetical protein [Rhodococcus pyridinivorans]|uniref:hypothetical protein n=1 Tax=Rhodococcus pyridinivorans TaxID=103816 RepID=UPI001D151300|nr:hypothetical protein [Rhodococcus pyridinivorans]
MSAVPADAAADAEAAFGGLVVETELAPSIGSAAVRCPPSNCNCVVRKDHRCTMRPL